MSDVASRTLCLRLAGPLQSWGTRGQYNRRETSDRPTKSGVIGLLAAAQGRRRGDDITDLLGLSLAVRVDQPGTLLRDYHTVSTVDGSPLLSSNLDGKGVQKPTSPKKATHVTERFYLSDAVFVAAVGGDADLIDDLANALVKPRFALALGRRACVPAGRVLLTRDDGGHTWEATPEEVLSAVPWQASERRRRQSGRPRVDLEATVDDPAGDDVASDMPVNFAPTRRGMLPRSVRHTTVSVPTGLDVEARESEHDPFELL